MTRPGFIARVGAALLGALGLSEPSHAKRAASAPIPGVESVRVRWNEVPGATGYEIALDGVVVEHVNRNARTRDITVDDATLIEITDLPGRSLVQGVDVEQGTGPA